MTQSGNCSVAVELTRYVEWFLTSSQAEAEVENRFMAPVSPSVANRIRSTVLERMTCDGQLLMDLVRRQKYEEEESLKTWKLPVQIVSPVVAITILLLVIYVIRHKIQCTFHKGIVKTPYIYHRCSSVHEHVGLHRRLEILDTKY